SIELWHAVDVRRGKALTQGKIPAAVPTNIVLQKVLIEEHLQPGQGLLGQFDHLGVFDGAIRVQAHSYPDRAVDGELGENCHRRHELSSRISSKIEAVQLIFSLPAPLLPNRSPFFCGQSDLADEKFCRATGHAADGVLLREQHDRRSDVGQYATNTEPECEG